jgi:hypothetical protein
MMNMVALYSMSKLTAPVALVLLASLGCQTPTPAHEKGPTGGISTDVTSSGEAGDAGACATHGDCEAGEICQSGVCLPNASGGPCDSDLDCIEGEHCELGECVSEGEGSDEMGCGGEAYEATAIPPNVMILLDRSGSMNEALDNNQGTKWDAALDAIGKVVTDYGDQVRFGLSLYPGLDLLCDEGVGCAPGAVFVDVGPGTASSIIDDLAAVSLCDLGTPTAEALAGLQDYPGLEDLERENYVLLITDGQSTCGDPVDVVEALRGESPEIKTFVVGFGDGADPDELNDMAEAGGTALQGDAKYYQADDAQALVDAFGQIVLTVMSCTFVLNKVPPDPDELYVYVNGMAVARDPMHIDGWDYEADVNRITFYGPPCNLLQSGKVMDLEFIFGCPEAP